MFGSIQLMKILLTVSFLTQTSAWTAGLRKYPLAYRATPLTFATEVFLQAILGALQFIFHNKFRTLSMQIFFDEPHLVAKRRAVFFAKWSKRAAELKGRESEVLHSCPEHVEKIMKGKNLQLLREILSDLEYPDKTLVDDLCSGFKLTGWLPKGGVFPGRIKHPEYDVKTLKMLAKGLNKSILAQIKNTEVDDVAESTWATTLEERSLVGFGEILIRNLTIK